MPIKNLSLRYMYFNIQMGLLVKIVKYEGFYKSFGLDFHSRENNLGYQDWTSPKECTWMNKITSEDFRKEFNDRSVRVLYDQ